MGVLAAVDAVLERAGADAAAVESFAHGMTVGTNALLTERGANTALVATAGFTDLLDIGRQARPELYRPCAPKPAPAGQRTARRRAERIGPAGVIEALAEGEPERIAAAIRAAGAESVAICLLFSYLDPAHERALADHLRSALPGVHVSASSEVLPQFREYERCSTTVIDAYLAPLLALLPREPRRARRASAACPRRRSCSPPAASRPPARRGAPGAWSVLSGPAGGAVGASLVASLSGDGNAIGIDMGGTSCDVCVVEGGRVRRTDGRGRSAAARSSCRWSTSTPSAPAAARSRWIDHGGALRVGPRSAGAEPGPACYGRGGTEATVTDANLAARLPLPRLRPRRRRRARRRGGAGGRRRGSASEIGLDPLETAEGIVRVANQEMLRALRVVSVERGVDPRRYALLPFGGAGPLHAAALAEELGMERMLCPRASGVLSRARPGGIGAPPRHRAHRDAERRGADRRARRPPRSTRCASASGTAWRTPGSTPPTSCATAARRSS